MKRSLALVALALVASCAIGCTATAQRVASASRLIWLRNNAIPVRSVV